MGLNNFILTCEKDNEELRKDINYYNNMTSRLKKENQELKKQLEDTNEELELVRCADKDVKYQEKLKLQQRIDKAIEYIKSNSHKTEWGDLEQDNESIDINDDITDTEFIENLLEILKGDNNE